MLSSVAAATLHQSVMFVVDIVVKDDRPMLLSDEPESMALLDGTTQAPSKRSLSAPLFRLPSAAPVLPSPRSSNSPHSPTQRPTSSSHRSSKSLLATLTQVSLGLGGRGCLRSRSCVGKAPLYPISGTLAHWRPLICV